MKGLFKKTKVFPLDSESLPLGPNNFSKKNTAPQYIDLESRINFQDSQINDDDLILMRKEKIRELMEFEEKFNMRKFSKNFTKKERKETRRISLFNKAKSDAPKISIEKNLINEKKLELTIQNNEKQKTILVRKRKVKKEKKNCLRNQEQYKNNKFIIFPDDYFKNKWNTLLIILLIYSSLFTPFSIAFRYEDKHVFWRTISIIIDFIFITDSLLTMNTAYYFNDILVTNHLKIFKNYFMGWMIFDITCSLPYDLIFIMERSKGIHLINTIKFFRFIKIVKERKKIFLYFGENFKLESKLQRVILAGILLLIFCHIISCTWFLICEFEYEFSNNQENWFYHNLPNYNESEVFDKYIICFYFIVQTITTVGYGDVHAYSNNERVFCNILMIIGHFIYSYTIGAITILILNSDLKNEFFFKSLTILTEIKRNYKISKELFRKIKRHLRFGINLKENYTEFLESLPASLKFTMIIQMHQEIIQNVPFLKNKPNSFLSCICPLLKQTKILKNEYIFNKNDPAEEVFFIKSGKIAAVIPRYDNFEFIKIKKGYYFGELDILFNNQTRKYSYMTIKDTILYALDRKSFLKLFLCDFREIGTNFIKKSEIRLKRTQDIYKEAIKFCKKMMIKSNINNNFSTLNSFYQESPSHKDKKNNLDIANNTVYKQLNHLDRCKIKKFKNKKNNKAVSRTKLKDLTENKTLLENLNKFKTKTERIGTIINMLIKYGEKLINENTIQIRQKSKSTSPRKKRRASDFSKQILFPIEKKELIVNNSISNNLDLQKPQSLQNINNETSIQ